MPRRYFDYLPIFEPLNTISSIGCIYNRNRFSGRLYVIIIDGLLKGPKASDNPWGAKTLEWQTSSPPPHENFLTDPEVTAGPYEYR